VFAIESRNLAFRLAVGRAFLQIRALIMGDLALRHPDL
jgi:hypothetical protein